MAGDGSRDGDVGDVSRGADSCAGFCERRLSSAPFVVWRATLEQHVVRRASPSGLWRVVCNPLRVGRRACGRGVFNIGRDVGLFVPCATDAMGGARKHPSVGAALRGVRRSEHVGRSVDVRTVRCIRRAGARHVDFGEKSRCGSYVVCVRIDITSWRGVLAPHPWFVVAESMEEVGSCSLCNFLLGATRCDVGGFH